MKNERSVQEFTLEGFPAAQHLGKALVLLRLPAHLASISGTAAMVPITSADARLQTPVHFLLSIFSLTESCHKCCYSSLAGHLSFRQANDFLCCLFLTSLCLCISGSSRFPPPSSDVSGSVPGHLQASSLHDHHEPEGLLPPGHSLLGFGLHSHCRSGGDGVPVMLLWPPCHTSLLL